MLSTIDADKASSCISFLLETTEKLGNFRKVQVRLLCIIVGDGKGPTTVYFNSVQYQSTNKDTFINFNSNTIDNSRGFLAFTIVAISVHSCKCVTTLRDLYYIGDVCALIVY